MRLIDADALNPMRCPRSIAEMREWIDNAPTIDAVEVVRCKDCRHAYKRKPINKTAVLCELYGAGMKDNDFCSYGERNEG